MKFFHSLSARFHLSMGLSSLTVSVLLLAVFIKLVPSTDSLVNKNRASLAESVASAVTLFLLDDEFENIQQHMEFIVERNDDLVGARVSRFSDDSQVVFGDDARVSEILDKHDQLFSQENGENGQDSAIVSTRDIVQVPLSKGAGRWGVVSLLYQSSEQLSLIERVRASKYSPVMFVGFLCFLLFYWYLGRMLKQLNPSSAVPGRVRSALDTLAEALLVINDKGEIVLANKAFSNLAGSAPEDLIGVSSDSFDWEFETDSSNSKETEESDNQYPWDLALANSETIVNSMLWFKDAEGKRRKFLVNCSPVMGNGDKAGGVLISLDDVTLLEEIEIQLIRSKEEAELANKAKSSFLSNMSHEIRTPMTAILGFTEVLKRGNGTDSDAAKKHLNTISSSGAHLLELINDVLDLSKVESGVLEIEEIECNPYKIVHDVATVLEVKAREKEISLDIVVDGKIPDKLLSDPSRLRQIITNLVGNAIKFTTEGGVKININTNGDSIVFDVVDSGIGMTEAQCDSIFEAFVQADSSITRRFGGTGLGLSISKKLSNAMGGDITVSSIPESGSTFRVELPLTCPESAEWLSEADLVSSLDLSDSDSDWQWLIQNKRVLVVDDALENRELLTLVLQDIGVTVDVAENGAIGVEKYESGQYDTILMDIQMPIMDGYEAVGQIRQKGGTLPIVALTANAMKGFEKKVLDAGFSHYQTKPIDIDKLYALVAGLLDGEKVSREAVEKDLDLNHVDGADVGRTDAELKENQISYTDLPEHDELYNSLVAGNKRFKPMADAFLEKLCSRLPTMHKAYSKGEFSELANSAHWLKGSAGSVGFSAFTQPAKTLENAARQEQVDDMHESLRRIDALARRLGTDTVPATDSLDATDVNDKLPEAQNDSFAVNEASDNSTRSFNLGGVEIGPQDLAEGGGLDSDDQMSDSTAPIHSSLPMHNPKFVNVIREFCKKLDIKLPELKKAIDSRELETVADIAHWLKGSGGNVGYKCLSKPAGRMEDIARSGQSDGISENYMQIVALQKRLVVPDSNAGGSSDLKKSA